MAQLWGGRFTKETDQLVYNFNASISFDQKFYKQDIEGSIAHVRMLGKQGILTQEEMQAIVSCLQEILCFIFIKSVLPAVCAVQFHGRGHAWNTHTHSSTAGTCDTP